MLVRSAQWDTFPASLASLASSLYKFYENQALLSGATAATGHFAHSLFPPKNKKDKIINVNVFKNVTDHKNVKDVFQSPKNFEFLSFLRIVIDHKMVQLLP